MSKRRKNQGGSTPAPEEAVMAGAEETTEPTNLDAQAPEDAAATEETGDTGLLADDGTEAASGTPGVAVDSIETTLQAFEARLEYVEGMVDKLGEQMAGIGEAAGERFDAIEVDVARVRAYLQGPVTAAADAALADAAADEALGPVIMRVRAEDSPGHRRGGLAFTREWRFVREGEVTEAQAKAIMDDTRLECELVG